MQITSSDHQTTIVVVGDSNGDRDCSARGREREG